MVCCKTQMRLKCRLQNTGHFVQDLICHLRTSVLYWELAYSTFITDGYAVKFSSCQFPHWYSTPTSLSLTHWGRVTHICVGKQTIIGSDNGLSPGRRQAIIWTNAGILLIGVSETNFSEISIKILIFSFAKMRLKVSSAKWRPFGLGLNVLRAIRLGGAQIWSNVCFTCSFSALNQTS